MGEASLASRDESLFTLRNFLDAYHFTWIHHYLPEEAEPDAVILSASIIGFPVEGFVRRGDLVIVAIRDYFDTPDLVFQLIRDVCQAGAACLLLSHKDNRCDLDEDAMRFIRENGFPVFLIPWERTFSNIFEFVMFETSRRDQRDAYVWKLAAGDITEAERAEHLAGVDLRHAYTCVVAQMDPGRADAPTEDDAATSAFESDLVKREILILGQELELETLLALEGDRFVLYLQNDEASHTLVESFLDTVERRVGAKLPTMTFSWGVSEISAGETRFASYYGHARLAETYCAHDGKSSSRFFFRDTFLFSSISELSASKKVMGDAADIIAPLVEYDRKKRATLVRTLVVYLKVRNVSKASRILNLHRQSLLYQMGKIESLTGLSLKDSNDLYVLETCLRLTLDFDAEQFGVED